MHGRYHRQLRLANNPNSSNSFRKYNPLYPYNQIDETMQLRVLSADKMLMIRINWPETILRHLQPFVLEQVGWKRQFLS